MLNTSAIDMMTGVVAEKLHSTPGKLMATTYSTCIIAAINYGSCTILYYEAEYSN